MNTKITSILMRKRSAKDWSAIVVLGFALAVGVIDAAFGINGLATTSDLAASNVVDVADVIIGVAAAWLLHG